MNRILSATILAAALGVAAQAMAQSQMSGLNGLAASPRVRKMLSELPVAVVPVVATAPQAKPLAVAESPRVQKQRSELPQSITPAAVAPVYTAPGGNPIAASPKLQEQLDERPLQFQIAPLK